MTRNSPVRDERIVAWEAVAKHPAFTECYRQNRLLLISVIARLDELVSMKPTMPEAAPSDTDLAEAIGNVCNKWSTGAPIAQMVVAEVRGVLFSHSQPVQVEVTDSRIAKALSIIDRDVEALANLDPTELRAALGGVSSGE